MPETHLSNDLRSPNNNNQFARTRGSLCLSPVTSPSVVDNKRRSWCGTPTSQLHSRRYGELANLKMRCDDFLGSYLNKPQNRRSLEMSTSLQSSLPCQLVPAIPAPSTVSSRESLLSSNSGSDASSELSEEGYCHCNSSLKGYFTRASGEDPVLAKFLINIGTGINCGTSYLRAAERQKVVKEIEEVGSVEVYRANQSEKIMNFDDPKPPYIRSVNVLHVAKSENLAKDYIHDDAVEALNIMKNTTHANEIRDIGKSPFSVDYWTNEQVHIYKRIYQSYGVSLCVDSTGLKLKSMKKRYEKEESSLFLYIMSVNCPKGQMTVAQRIGSRHTTRDLLSFFMDFHNCGSPYPNEFVCDESRAILNAAVLMYTRYINIEEYADALESENIHVRIRIDVAHHSNKFRKLFKGLPRISRTLYMAALGQLRITEDLREAKLIIEAIFILANSENESPGGAVSMKREFLEKLVTEYNENINQELMEETEDRNNEQFIESYDTKKNKLNRWGRWGEEIFNKAKDDFENGGIKPNYYFLPNLNLTKFLIKDLQRFPIWGSIYNFKYTYGSSRATSAPAEGEFNKIKNNLLANIRQPVRVDQFVDKHLRYLNGKSRLLGASLSENVKDRESDTLSLRKSISPNGFFEKKLVALNEVENWRNKGNPRTNSNREIPNICLPCQNGDKPTGAHTCLKCGKAVHAFGCSVPIPGAAGSDDEGYGSRRLCLECSTNFKEGAKHLDSPPRKKTYRQPAKYFGDRKNDVKDSLYWKTNRTLPIIKNGNDPSLSSVKISAQQTVTLRNTCAFDSLLYIGIIAVTDFPFLRDQISSMNTSFSAMLLNMLENGLHSNTYVLRGRVLADVFPITESELGGHVIQCGVEVGWLANKLFKGLPSFSEQSTCENCSFTKINKLTSISVQEESLRTFEPATFIINSCLNATLSHCPQCQSEESVRHELVEIGYGVICDIGLLERIVLSHPIWFLPGIQRAGAFHLLQGKEEGCFVVRKSSQPDTMALSVRLPPDKGPYIEHYLIHSSEGRLGLETSENRFVDISALVAHYASCCDELPIQLTLPKAIRESKSRQQLSSLALLGQEFWSYSPPVSAVSSPEVELVLNLNPLMSTFKQAETSSIVPCEKPVRPNTLNLLFRNDPSTDSLNALMEQESSVKTPPQPPPRWSKPTTPNNFTVTTTVTFSVNAQSPNNGISQESLNVDQKRMSPEGQCVSTISSRGSRGSLGRTSLNHVGFHGSVTSPHSATPDTLSPLSVSESARHSKRHKLKISKHYQESDIVDSPTMYYRSGLGDRISDYEDLWTNEKNQPKPVPTNISSPDILQHTPNVGASNNNISESSQSCMPQRSNCFSCENQSANEDIVGEPTTPICLPEDLTSPHVPKQGSPFYAEPADALMPGQIPKKVVTRSAETPTSHSISPLQSFKLVNFRVKPDREHNEVGDSDNKNDAIDADSDFEWLKIPKYLSTIEHADQDDRSTLQDLILKRFPDLNITSGLVIDKEAYRISAYDNVDDKRSPRAPLSEISELTEFSDPWAEVNSEVGNISNCDSIPVTNMRVASINKARPARDPSLTVPFPSRNIQSNEPKAIGGSIRSYALQLAQDKTTTFAQNIDNFIACTRESKEKDPHVVMRNIRQFMSGMKNYLVKHGEKEFYKEIERERNKLKSTEFLNLDVILEEVMNKLVVKPLRAHLQKLFLDYYTRTGAIRLLADSIHYASFKQEKILKPQHRIFVPSDGVLERISHYLERLQSAHSPLEKLEYLLAAIAVLFNSVKTAHSTFGKTCQLGTDDFLPLLVWVLVKTKFVSAEIECEYMYGLLHPPLLSGEGGYYLTTLSSAVHFLKNFKESCEENVKSQAENNAVLKIVVPDELHGSILTKTLPARPHMTTKEVCKIIAHKARITNPQDYALYRLTEGEEMMLLDNECPQDILKALKRTMLVYKRIDAKIAWPKQDKDTI